MAQRPIWRGHLRLALVSCPVALFHARHDREAIRFNMINPATGNRIKMVSQDAKTGEPISRGETVKGYEYKKDHYLILADEDLDRVKIQSSTLMVVEKFVGQDLIDPIYYDASYYLAPDGKGSEDVYAVVREAIHRSGKTALTRVVIGQRERTVAVRPLGDGLVAHTLNEERDLNSAKPLFEDLAHVTVDPEMVQLAVQLVARQTGRYDPADLEDRYETRLRAMLEARIRGVEENVADEPVATHSNVIDLMAALKRSLTQTASGAAIGAGAAAPSRTSPAAAAAAMSKSGQEREAAMAVRAAKPARGAKPPTAEDIRRQPEFKLPIDGGGQKATKIAAAEKRGESEVVERTPRARRKAS